MSVGAGIAIVGVWGCVTALVISRSVTGVGMALMIIAALMATGTICDVVSR